jgi:hypothetical protein
MANGNCMSQFFAGGEQVESKQWQFSGCMEIRTLRETTVHHSLKFSGVVARVLSADRRGARE